jgi:hypothetical protein
MLSRFLCNSRMFNKSPKLVCNLSSISPPIIVQKVPVRAALKPISANIGNNVGSFKDIKKLCCRKGCLKCVDTPSYREKTIGRAGAGRR